MNRFYLVRHGENLANLTKEFSNRRVDYALTPKGVLQAQQTADYFKDKGIDAVYSSPLKRAQQTAQIIATAVGVTAVVLENLREVDVGDLEGQPPTAELWALHNAVVRDWMTGHPEKSFPNGENHTTLCRRMRAAFAEMTAGRDGKDIVVVGHGGIFTFTLLDWCPGLDLSRLRNREYANCGITEVEIETRGEEITGQLVTWAEHGHLHGEAAELVSGTMK